MGEPVAVVGMACRFPRAPGLEAYWKLLTEAGNAVTEGVPGRDNGRLDQIFANLAHVPDACRFGAFVDRVDQFDPGFFRISPIEAQLLDPQQRLTLETTWRALENAAIDPDRLRQSQTGVYVGLTNLDYRDLVLNSLDTADPATSLYAGTGSSMYSVAGRVSYVLGLNGPAMSIDTACASSMVAVDLAAGALRQKEIDIALAGGVHVILDPRAFEARANAGILSPVGRCKTFDASADGYVRGDGCGFLVLKRLSDAHADHDRIWCVIRATAVAHGGASVGFSVPNATAQQQVIEQALCRAQIEPGQVDYLEAHGTGTATGDPIELNAAGAAYGPGRSPDRPLFIGSVKTNIGHLEPVAGVAGLIKTALALKRGYIPAHRNFENPTPAVDWASLRLQVVTELARWPDTVNGTRLAGVSSYGISGTNAHAVLESHGGTEPRTFRFSGAPCEVGNSPRAKEYVSNRTHRMLPLSGKSAKAVQMLAQSYLSWLEEAADDRLADIAWTATTGRTHFSWRKSAVGSDLVSMRRALARIADGTEKATSRRTGPRHIAFAFTGQGAQWVGMGRTLYQQESVFRVVVDKCEQTCLDITGKSLLDVMFGESDQDLDNTAWALPATYALQCALTALWSSVGVRPVAVIGHSTGEIAAACAAGILTLEDGFRLAHERARLAASTEPGAMAALFASKSDVIGMIGGRVSIAAENGTHVVISGPKIDVDQACARIEAAGRFTHRLRTKTAFHSALLDPILDELHAIAQSLTHSTPQTAYVSSLTGQILGDNQILDGVYWSRHARHPVVFESAIETLASLDVDTVIEIGPDQVLGPVIAACWKTPETLAVLWSQQHPKRTQTGIDAPFAQAVAQAYDAGIGLNLAECFNGERRRRTLVPGYPFQRSRYWFEGTKRSDQRIGKPLVVQPSTLPDPVVVNEATFSHASSDRAELPAAPDAGADCDAVEESHILQHWAGLDESERYATLLRLVQREVQSIMELPSEVSPTIPFSDLGVDSLIAVALRNRLNQALEGILSVSSTAVFEFPDAHRLTRHLLVSARDEMSVVSI